MESTVYAVAFKGVLRRMRELRDPLPLLTIGQLCLNTPGDGQNILAIHQ